jgi:hypothetical protein
MSDLGSQQEVLAMTSGQRPKECSSSRYRHGSEPPKQVETSPNSSSLFSDSFDPFTFIQCKELNFELERCQAPPHQEGGLFDVYPSTITVVVPCAENESVFLLHAVKKQQFMLIVKVALRVTGSRLVMAERLNLISVMLASPHKTEAVCVPCRSMERRKYQSFGLGT